MRSKLFGLFFALFVLAHLSACQNLVKKSKQPNSPPTVSQPLPPEVEQPSMTQYITMEGHVTLSDSKTPVRDAIVSTSLDTQTVKTNSEGFFFLKTRTFADGAYANRPFTLNVTAPGYETFSKNHVWGERAAQQTFPLAVLDPFAGLKALAGPVVEKEYSQYLSKTVGEIPTLLTGQPARENELQKAFTDENNSARAGQTEENKKFVQDKEKDSGQLEKTLSGKEEKEQARLQREHSAKWEQLRATKQKRQQDELFYLRGRQTLERRQLRWMFEQEREKFQNPDADLTQSQSESWQDYLKKRELASYLIALGQGGESTFPDGQVKISFEPAAIEQGQNTKLVWEAWNTEATISIEPDLGTVTGQRLISKKPLVKTETGKTILPPVGYGSSLNLSPGKTTSYKIKAKDWNGKEVEASAEIKVTEPTVMPSTFQWRGLLEDVVGKGNDALTSDGEPDGVFELAIEGSFNELVLMTADADGNICCGQQWDTVPSGKPPEGTLYPDPADTWVLGLRGLSREKIQNRANGSLEPWRQAGRQIVRLYAGNSGYFHDGQNFVLFIYRPKGVEKVQARIDAEPVAPDLTRHEAPKVRDFTLRAVCAPGKASYVANTSWNPKILDVNQTDTVHLTVYGPPANADPACFSVSLAISEFDVLLPKIAQGEKQEVTFKANKAGKFSYVDSERRLAQTGKFKTMDIRQETFPGVLTVLKNVPPLTGVCMVRDLFTPAPALSDPDSGKGYAKKTVPGVQDMASLKNAAAPELFKTLIDLYYGGGNTRSFEAQLVTYDHEGKPVEVTCAVSTCASVSINPPVVSGVSGICIVQDAYAKAPHFNDPDVGKGYAKKAIPGTNDIDALAKAGTEGVFKELIDAYVAAGNKNPVMKLVMTYTPYGDSSDMACAGPCGFMDVAAAVLPSTDKVIEIRSKCELSREHSGYVEHWWAPEKVDVQKGQKVKLVVYGSESKNLSGNEAKIYNDNCKSVTFSLEAFGVLLPAIPFGGKKEMVFEASKTGAFPYKEMNIKSVKINIKKGIFKKKKSKRMVHDGSFEVKG